MTEYQQKFMKGIPMDNSINSEDAKEKRPKDVEVIKKKHLMNPKKCFPDIKRRQETNIEFP